MIRFIRVTLLWVLLAPIGFMALGGASNQAVLIANGGKFPAMATDRWLEGHGYKVDSAGMIDEIHCRMTSTTRLNALGDVFNLQTEIKSLGDMAIELGLWLEGFCSIVWGALVIRKLTCK